MKGGARWSRFVLPPQALEACLEVLHHSVAAFVGGRNVFDPGNCITLGMWSQDSAQIQGGSNSMSNFFVY